jgi:hypothetical protein
MKKFKHSSYDDWIADGLAQKWCGPAICHTHDGLPTTEAEDAEFEAGGDPCLHIVRLYPNPETAAEVEANHSPSQWRKQ